MNEFNGKFRMIKSLARNTDNDLLKNRESQNSIENYFNKSSE